MGGFDTNHQDLRAETSMRIKGSCGGSLHPLLHGPMVTLVIKRGKLG